ncbi:MAG: NADH-quinone oxidoreductase subunit H, partial [Candidatus Omnitrophica bacterium]|nr:NADH-quinone oxidoreductase subunit H [Candidatus Omnitrophota bacterium]
TVFLLIYANLIHAEKLQMKPSWRDVGLILGLAFVFSIYAYSIFIEIIKTLSAFTVSLVNNLTPVYGIIFAGWSSNNKYSLLGGLRSSAQMISYELGMGLSIVAVLMTYQDVSISAIVEKQAGFLNLFGVTLPLPNWGMFLQPIAFITFVVAAFAETNRTPFDLAEGESEIVAGYHTEYSSMKFALFFMAEYANMAVASIVIATLFLGGYQVPFFTTEILRQNPNYTLIAILVLTAITSAIIGWIIYKRAKVFGSKFQESLGKKEYYFFSYLFFGLAIVSLTIIPIVFQIEFSQLASQVIVAIFQISMLLAKAMIFLWLYVHVRWTLPRFRYDQLMNMGWKLMLPISLINVIITGIIIIL